MDEHPEDDGQLGHRVGRAGNLIEPHTGKRTPLGTLAYVTTWRARAGGIARRILFCEKEGFQPLFEAVNLGERFDLRSCRPREQRHRRAHLIDALIKDGKIVYCSRDST